MAFEYRKLLGRIVEIFNTRRAFAEAMGISEKTLTFKLSGQSGWTQQEMLKACELLQIPKEQLPDYFFVLAV